MPGIAQQEEQGGESHRRDGYEPRGSIEILLAKDVGGEADDASHDEQHQDGLCHMHLAELRVGIVRLHHFVKALDFLDALHQNEWNLKGEDDFDADVCDGLCPGEAVKPFCAALIEESADERLCLLGVHEGVERSGGCPSQQGRYQQCHLPMLLVLFLCHLLDVKVIEGKHRQVRHAVDGIGDRHPSVQVVEEDEMAYIQCGCHHHECQHPRFGSCSLFSPIYQQQN